MEDFPIPGEVWEYQENSKFQFLVLNHDYSHPTHPTRVVLVVLNLYSNEKEFLCDDLTWEQHLKKRFIKICEAS